jgi:transcriptional regulator with XRE-family HTH domain
VSEDTPIDPSTDTAQDDAVSSPAPNHGKKGRGNRWTPTEEQRRQVKLAAAFGMKLTEIAELVGVSAPTLSKVCKKEISSGRAEAIFKVTGRLFQMATDPRNKNPVPLIYLTKAWLGWRDRDAAGGAENPAKKQERKDAAKRIGGAGKFAPGKGPKLSVVK